MTETLIEVGADRTRLRHGLLRSQQVAAPPGWIRLGLLATSALLLGGDEVELTVRVQRGCRLALFDVAGTVAYHGRGRPASWHVRIDLARGAELTWSGEPFVVADGAEVARTLVADLDDSASLTLRETLVLGRTGERGGRLRNRTTIRRIGEPVLIEDQLLDPVLRRLPGILGAHRVVDSLLVVGADAAVLPAGAASFRLPGGTGTLTRWLGSSAADSPLAGIARCNFHHLVEIARDRPTGAWEKSEQ